MTKPSIPGSDRSADKAQGHWLLARVGKKVLRPGGRETTDWLISRLEITGKDAVEFAPGLGITAKEILGRNPNSYVGVDQDENAIANIEAILPKRPGFSTKHGSAEDTGLADESADVVIGEAMLTMQTDKHKLEIMREAHRILRPGGRYAIHELGLEPDELDEKIKKDIQQSLARAIKVNARPLTIKEWSELAREAGFEVTATYRADMALLEPKRVIADEGIKGFLRIVFNVVRQPDIRRRVMTMRNTFKTHAENLNAVGLILTKK